MKSFESITFKVEKDLKKPIHYLPIKGIKEIFGNMFQKIKTIKDQKTGKEIPLNENKPLEVFHYSLDTNEQFYSCGKKSLIQGLIEAYKNHYGIVVSPDWIWILILQGYSRFMEKYSELVREKIVNFVGKKDLKLNRLDYSPREAKKEVWDGMIKEYLEKMENYVGKELILNLECDFSTTTPVSKITSQVGIMSAMKQYFTYKVIMAGCGISNITLEGSIQDWVKIKSKLQFLSSKAMGWWTKHLIPIIDNIIATKMHFYSHKKPSKDIVDFWKGMIRVKGEGDQYNPYIINGWIVKFIPNLTGNTPTLYEELSENEVPDQIISCPMELTWFHPATALKTDFNCSLASGFYGMVQDKNTFSVKPVIGYAIVVEEENNFVMTFEEKNRIINDYFN